ncbi:hypothetical protein B5G43_12170 [Flavonifractor sp. An92]|uniref:S8 family serine peptidase n=1 Tax=Flavonifractor sp. An92 TaxID=1965666 RepID=UPI000B387D08|nr:S8 family serine peptidase [Flavonifractor sp. An92]OUN05660.1 hypothetical protein B5G43_12170 [Flavonifractor sp. An92]
MKRLCSAVLALCVLTALLPAPSARAAEVDTEVYEDLAALVAENQSDTAALSFTVGETTMTVTDNAGKRESVDIDPGRDTAPLVVAERTLLPARALVESMGGEITYEGGNTVTIYSQGRTVQLEAGDNTLLVDGEAVELDVAPCFHEERTYLPVRGITEALDCQVDWDPDTETATVVSTYASRRLLVMGAERDDLDAVDAEQALDLGGGLWVLSFADEASTARAQEVLEGQDLLVTPDAQTEAVLSGGISGSWENQRTGLSDFGKTQAGSRPVTVAVLDTGINPNLFPGRVLDGFDFQTGREGVSADPSGHGTFVASLIAAYTPECVTLLPVRLFSADGTLGHAQLSVLSAGLLYAAEAGADLANLSFTLGANDLFDAVVEEVTAGGMAVVAAAGNSRTDTALFSPARCEDAIVVAATDQNDRLADFSNAGDSVDLCAPGVGITGQAPSGGMYTDSGTSFSAPLVAAAGAVLLTANAYMPAALEEELKAYATPLSQAGTGAGVLDLREAQPEPTPTPTPTPSPTPSPEPTPDPEPEETPRLTSFRWSHTRVELTEGKQTSIQLLAHYVTQDGSYEVDATAESRIYSTDESVVTVEPDGSLTAAGAGSAYLVCSRASVSGIALPEPLAVTVEATPAGETEVEKVALSASSLLLRVDQQTTLTAVAYPYDAADTRITWSTSNPEVATVKNGTVHALGEGDCLITASASNGVSASCRVRVSHVNNSDFALSIRSGPRTLSLGDVGSYELELDTPQMDTPLVLWCGIYVDGAWLEYASCYVDSGTGTVLQLLDTAQLEGVEPGTYLASFSLFEPDRFYTGASLVDCVFQLHLT